LRDTFCKELNNLPKKELDDEEERQLKNHRGYFKSMMFLKDQFLLRKMHSSVLENNTDLEMKEYKEYKDI